MTSALSAAAAAVMLGGCVSLVGLPPLPGSHSESVTALCIGCAGGGVSISLVEPPPDDGAPAQTPAPPAPAGSVPSPRETGPAAAAREANADEPPAQALAREAIRVNEGLRLEPYLDTTGAPHIGYGHRLTVEEAERLLDIDLETAARTARRVLGPAWAGLDPARRAALIEAAYVLGERGLARFTRMLAALESGDYETAADELLDSRWARIQAPARTDALARQLRTGRMGGNTDSNSGAGETPAPAPHPLP